MVSNVYYCCKQHADMRLIMSNTMRKYWLNRLDIYSVPLCSAAHIFHGHSYHGYNDRSLIIRGANIGNVTDVINNKSLSMS